MELITSSNNKKLNQCIIGCVCVCVCVCLIVLRVELIKPETGSRETYVICISEAVFCELAIIRFLSNINTN